MIVKSSILENNTNNFSLQLQKAETINTANKSQVKTTPTFLFIHFAKKK